MGTPQHVDTVPSPRRPGPGPDDRRPGGSDLPDDKLPIQGHRACGEPLRPEGIRQHLYPPHEPDHRRPREAGRPDGRRRGRSRAGQRAVRDHGRAAEHRPGRRRDRLRRQPLRRDLQPLPLHLPAPRRESEVLPLQRPRRPAGRHRAEDPRRLRRVDRQPQARCRRHRGARAGGARGRRAAGHRQHRLAVPAAADRSRRGHRRLLGHQVHRRPRHLARRPDRGLREVRLDQRAVPADRRARSRAITGSTSWRRSSRWGTSPTSSRPGSRCCATSARR